MGEQAMSTTIDGVPWREARLFGDDGPTIEQWNTCALIPASRTAGYCLCYHPMGGVINFTGLGCQFCGQPVTDQSTSAEAKQLRTAATKESFPELFIAGGPTHLLMIKTSRSK
jgi:hypothetical protein